MCHHQSTMMSVLYKKIIPKTLQRKSESRSWLDISIHEKWCTFSNRIKIADKSHSVTELNVFLYEKKAI